MAEIVNMPKMTDTMEEGVLSSWLVKVGDKVAAGDALAEVETDKATMELESYFDGTVLSIEVEAGSTVKIDQPICVIGKEGEKVEIPSSAPAASAENDTKEEAREEAPAATPDVDLSSIPAKAVNMPLMSDTMTEGVIASWLKNIGDPVESGEAIAEVETDKATMELEAYEDGTLLYQAAKPGESVPVNEVVAIIGKDGTDFQPLLATKPAASAAPSPEPKQETVQAEVGTNSPAVETVAPVVQSSSNGRIFSTPLARKLAEEKGLDLAQVNGSGPNGRITKSDIESFKPGSAPAKSTGISPSLQGVEGFRDEPVSQMRKTIARRLSDSKFSAPHFYLTMAIRMDKAMEARKAINAREEGKISFNDMVIKAAAMALRKHPKVNASWLDDKIRYYDHIHVGVAVAVDEGLLVPVIRFADGKSFHTISGEVKELAVKAKDKKLQPSEWEGNTFTISNLGMFGIDEFTAIINPPDACILAVGGIDDVPKLIDGELVNTHVMKVTLSCDHRVVDGATGAEFLNTFKAYLEDPVLMLA